MSTLIAPPETPLLAAVRKLRPQLEERAAQTERDRRLPDETIEALHEVGVFRSVLPKRVGGLGLTLMEEMEVMAELGRACGSTAWVGTLLADVNCFPAALLSQEGQDEIYADDRVLCCGVIAPSGTATPVDGGYRVTGSWGFASGCLHADWMVTGTIVLTPDGPAPGFAAFRLSEATIKDTWHVAGMKGTGSNTVVAEDVFVPASRVGLVQDRMIFEATPHPELDPSERWPLAPYFSTGLLGPTLGMADRAFELVAEGMKTRGVSYFDFEKQTDSAVLQHNLAEAKMHIESAWLHIRENCHQLDEVTKERALEPVERARIRAKGGFACAELRTGVDMLVSIAGGSGFAEKNPIQRIWRDVNVGTRHALDNTAGCLEAYGRAYTGVENITPWI